MAKRYALAPGTQVREEDFGLLFYTMEGPRLYFLSSGELLDSSFFWGEISLEEFIEQRDEHGFSPKHRTAGVVKALVQLGEKGVIIEC